MPDEALDPAREGKLLHLIHRLSAAALDMGRQHCLRETPAEYRRVSQLQAAGAGRLQLRIDVGDDSIAIAACLVDDAEELLAIIYRVTAQVPTAGFH